MLSTSIEQAPARCFKIKRNRCPDAAQLKHLLACTCIADSAFEMTATETTTVLPGSESTGVLGLISVDDMISDLEGSFPMDEAVIEGSDNLDATTLQDSLTLASSFA